MANVLPTTLDTTLPGDSELTICDGFALFQEAGAFRAKTKLDDTSGTFFDTSLNFELFKMSVSADHSAFVGVCGPSYAIKADTSADTGYQVPAPGQPSSGNLVLDEHVIRGGFQCGVLFQINLEFLVTLNLVFKKETLVDAFAGVYINLIELIINELLALLAGGGGGGEEGNPNDIEMSSMSSVADAPDVEEGQPSGQGSGGTTKPGKFDGAGMINAVTNPFAPSGDNSTFNGPRTTEIAPNLAYGFDIVPLILDAAGLVEVAEAAEALEKIGCGFEMGPGVSIGLPTSITLLGATISNHPFGATGGQPGSPGPDDDATVTLYLEEETPISPNLQPLTDTPDEIGLLLEHEVGFSLGLFFFADFIFFKVIHFGAQTGEIPLFYTEAPGGGPFLNHLDFIPGGGPIPFAAPDIAPTVGAYTANQPQGSWTNGVLARYGVSYFNSSYESEIGPLTDFDPQQRFFAFPEISNIPGAVPEADGVRVYREFNDGSPPVQVAELDFTVENFIDTKP
jgi:hypothetical protein